MTGTVSPVRKTVLANGLTIVTERISHVRSVSLGVWIRAGARTDDIERMGMAHFIEHMLFKGTERRTAFDIADILESLGGSLNAFTARDMTCYYASVLDEHLEQAVDVLSDILCHSVISPEEIEREKLVVLEEIHSAEDIPEEFVQDTFGDIVLSPDPSGKPILGKPETVREFTRENIRDYMCRYYTGKNAIIAAAGNIEHDRFVELVASQFTFHDADISYELQPVPNLYNQRTDIIRKIQQAHLCIGGSTFGYCDKRRTALWLLNTFLGNGMSSRLFQEIREKHGLAYTVYSYTELLRDRGFIATYAATKVASGEKVLGLIRDEFEKLSEYPLDSMTLDRVKSQVKGSLVLSLESTSNRMNRLAKQEILLGTFYSIDDTIGYIEKTTAKDIQSVAQDIFNPKDIKTVVVAPQRRNNLLHSKE